MTLPHQAGQCRFEPGETVEMSLSQWADIAGVKLDDPITTNDNVKKNVDEAAKYMYPAVRLTGAVCCQNVEGN